MDTLLWTLQCLLAAVFLITGMTKLTQPRAKLAAGPMKWAAEVTDNQFRAIGFVEVLGAVGVVTPAALGIAPILTPAALGIAPILTPLAAAGLVVTMIAAAFTHLKLGEISRIGVPLLFLTFALFVAVERFGPHSL
jgi:hypothetical protein